MLALNWHKHLAQIYSPRLDPPMLRRLTTILSLSLAAAIALAQPPPGGGDFGPPNQEKQGESKGERRGPPREADGRGGSASGGSAMRYKARRFAQALLNTHYEAKRLERDGEDIEEDRARLDSGKEEFDEGRLERRHRILDLKEELLELEREEFVATARRQTAILLERLKEFESEGVDAEVVADARPRLLRVQAAAVDFDTLIAALKVEEESFKSQGAGMREELRRREIGVLKERLGRLERGDSWGEHPREGFGPPPPRPPNAEHPRFGPPPRPEEEALMPGLGEPPEPGRRRPGPPPVE